MRNTLNKDTKKAINTKELNYRSIALRHINELLPQAKKASQNGLFRCEIKLNRQQRKNQYKKYYIEILKNKGFLECDIKILDKYIILKWFDVE